MVTDEVAGEATVVWVYASTTTSDATVTLGRGVHPEITQDCFIVYEQAEVVRTATIRAAVTGRALTQAAPLDAKTLEMIQDGIYVSEETPIGVIDYCHGRF